MKTKKHLVIRLNDSDNVVVACEPIPRGTRIDREQVITTDDIPPGHKIATSPIKADQPVRKYGHIIGFATSDIAPGEHVHTHNLEVKSFHREYDIASEAISESDSPKEEDTFEGIVRADGRVATRNYIGIISTVNCSASVARFIANEFQGDALAPFPNVDGVVPVCHSLGCAMGSADEGFHFLQATLRGWAAHPNFAGVLIVGLGCEVMQVQGVIPEEGKNAPDLYQSLVIQETGGTRRTIEEGVARVRSMLAEANRVKREPVSIKHLVVGLQCGGSDAYSGITANPALGAAVDILVRRGGTAILGETPEIYGAEHLLTRRAVSRRVGELLIERIRWWEQYTAKNAGTMDNNPSPGNKAGGLTTILEKSLGAIAKGGTTSLNAVYRYAEPVRARGLVFMDTPGYDPVSLTGMVAGGANLTAFTTGRGSVYGCRPVPTIKLASNSSMYQWMEEDMDINCGELLEGTEDLNDLGRRIYRHMIAVASGQRSKSERLGMGDNEFVPWHIGAVM